MRNYEELIKALSLEQKIKLMCDMEYWDSQEAIDLGLPVFGMVRAESVYEDGNSSLFSIAQTWNPELAYQQGKNIGAIALSTNNNLVYLSANPKNIDNGFISEDPVLANDFLASLVQGINDSGAISVVGNLIYDNCITKHVDAKIVVQSLVNKTLDLPTLSFGEDPSVLLQAIQSAMLTEDELDDNLDLVFDAMLTVNEPNEIVEDVEFYLASLTMLKNNDVMPVYDNPIILGRCGELELDQITEVFTIAGIEVKAASLAYSDNEEENKVLSKEALALIKTAEKAIVFLNTKPNEYEIPKNQMEIVSKLTKKGVKTIAVVNSCSVIDLSFSEDVDGLILANTLNTSALTAVSQVVAGLSNPSGKTSVSYPLKKKGKNKSEEMPGHDEFYFDGKSQFLYPFGSGISYVAFDYSEITAKKESVSFIVTNSSEFQSYEIVQVYISKPDAKNVNKYNKLVGYVKLNLNANESQEIELPIDENAYSYPDEKEGVWKTETGKYIVSVGPSLDDIRLTAEVEIESEPEEEQESGDYYLNSINASSEDKPLEDVEEAKTEDEAEAPLEDAEEAPTEEETEAPLEDVEETPAQEEAEAPLEDVEEAPAEEESEAPLENVEEAPTEEILEDTQEETTQEASEETSEEDPLADLADESEIQHEETPIEENNTEPVVEETPEEKLEDLPDEPIAEDYVFEDEKKADEPVVEDTAEEASVEESETDEPQVEENTSEPVAEEATLEPVVVSKEKPKKEKIKKEKPVKEPKAPKQKTTTINENIKDDGSVDLYVEEKYKSAYFSAKVRIFLLIVLLLYMDALFVLTYLYITGVNAHLRYYIYLGCVALVFNFITLAGIVRVFKNRRNRAVVGAKDLDSIAESLECPNYYEEEIVLDKPVEEEVSTAEEVVDEYYEEAPQNDGLMGFEEKEEAIPVFEISEEEALGEYDTDSLTDMVIDNDLDYEEEMTLEEMAEEIYKFVTDRGLNIDHALPRVVLSALASSRLIFVKSKTYEQTLKFFELLTKYLGGEYYIDYEAECWCKSEDIVWRSYRDTFVKTNFIKSVLASQSLDKNINLAFIENVTPEKLKDYFGGFLPYIKNPAKPYVLHVKGTRGDEMVQIPSNLWYVMFVRDETLNNMPYDIALCSTTIEVTVNTGTAIIAPVQYEKVMPCQHFLKTTVAEDSESFITEEDWKKFDSIERFVQTHFKYQIGNKLAASIEAFTSAYMLAGGEVNDAIDAVIAYKLLPTIFMANKEKAQLMENQLSEYLDQLFGAENLVLTQKKLKNIRFE